MTVSKKNIHEISAFINLGKRIHADQVKFSAIHNWHWTPEEFDAYSIFDSHGIIRESFLHYINTQEFSESIVYNNNIVFYE